jgi:hypothetical protein
MQTDFVKVDNFYLSDEYLRAETPSRQAGIDEETETMQRLYACEVIQTCGICLAFPQAVMSTGQVLLHRFYCKRPLTEYDAKVVALTCLWLAAKLEEVEGLDQNMWKVLIVFDRVTRRKDGKPLKLLELFSKKYYKMRDEVVRVERDLLVAFGYVMHVEHPHKAVVSYLSVMAREREGNPPMTDADRAKVKDLMQTAFNYVNDSLRTSLCVRYKADVVACGAIFLAARKLGIPLPEGAEGNWWDLFDVSLAEMSVVCVEILKLYSMPKSFYIPLTTSTSSRPARPQGGTSQPGGGTPERPPPRASEPPLPACVDPFDTPPGSMRSTDTGSVCAGPGSKQHSTTPLAGRTAAGPAAVTGVEAAGGEAEVQPTMPGSRLPPSRTPPLPPRPTPPKAPRPEPVEGNGAIQQQQRPEGNGAVRTPKKNGTAAEDRKNHAASEQQRDREQRGGGEGRDRERGDMSGGGRANNGDRERDRDRERERRRERDERDRQASRARSRPGEGDSGRGDDRRISKRDGEPPRGRSPKRPR